MKATNRLLKQIHAARYGTTIPLNIDKFKRKRSEKIMENMNIDSKFGERIKRSVAARVGNAIAGERTAGMVYNVCVIFLFAEPKMPDELIEADTE